MFLALLRVRSKAIRFQLLCLAFAVLSISARENKSQRNLILSNMAIISLNFFYFNWLHSPEVNGSILSQLFQVGENHKIWHKSAMKDGRFELIRSHVKMMLELLQVRFMFFVHMFA